MRFSEFITVAAFFASLVRCGDSVKVPLDENQAKVALYSYNIAGFFRKNDFGSQKAKDFQSKVASDIKQDDSKDAWMYIFAYQEIWNAGEVIQEQGSIVADWFRKDLKQKIYEFTLGVMKEAFAEKKDRIVCDYVRHETLMTVACRFFEGKSKPKEAWIVEAFKYGWTEHGGTTTRNIFGFKGLLAVSIALGDGKNLIVINVHLSSKKLKDRWKGIRIIKDLLKQYLYSTDHSILIVGDFNARSFSLVSPSIKNDDLSKFENNVGAGFLLLCLTDSLSGDNFYREMSAKEFCAEVLENAKKYDEITFFFKKEFPAAIEPDEVKSKTFMPTFCFNFEHKEFIKPYLGPKAGESIPSYTDRIFYVDSKDFTLNWQKYSDIPGPEGKIEFSDHRPIIGVMEIELSELAQTAFFTPKKIDQSKDLPSEKSEANFTYRNINYDLKSLVSSQKNDADSAYLYKTYKIPNYTKYVINHNDMLSNVNLQKYQKFSSFADKTFADIKKITPNRILL